MATKPALPRIGVESKHVWQSAYVQINTFGQNFESLGCLFHVSCRRKTEMYRNVKVKVNMFTKTERWNWNRWICGKSVDKKTNPHAYTICYICCTFPSFVILFIYYLIFTVLSFSLCLPLSLKKRGKMKNDLVDKKGDVIKFWLLNLVLMLCCIKTLLCQSPSAHIQVKVLQCIKAPLWSVLSVCGGRVYSSTEFSFIKVMQSRVCNCSLNTQKTKGFGQGESLTVHTPWFISNIKHHCSKQ